MRRHLTLVTYPALHPSCSAPHTLGKTPERPWADEAIAPSASCIALKLSIISERISDIFCLLIHCEQFQLTSQLSICPQFGSRQIVTDAGGSHR